VSLRGSPEAQEAERALLGGLLQTPDVIPTVAEMLRPEDFYRPDHGALFKLLVEMAGKGDTIDLITVPERVGREGRQDAFGGIPYVLELPDCVPSTANLPLYAEVIKEKALLRELIQAGSKLANRARTQPDDVAALISEAMHDLTSLGDTTRKSWQPISLIIDEELNRVQDLSETDGSTTGYTTGFVDLDKLLAGLQKTDLLILAARPGMGKTALALNIAQNVALLEEAAVGIFSLEMGRGQLVTRLLCCHGLVDAGRVRTGQLETADWDKLLHASEELRRTRVCIDDTPGLSISDLCTRARRLAAEHPDLALVVVDYLQLMTGDDARAPREQQISAISRGLKGLAKDLDCPVMALSQLNRGVETRQDKRPKMADLRESGAIEQDADIIMFIYRDERYNPDTADKGLAEVIVAKQRNGPTGTAKLVFQGEYTRFDNYLDDALNL
jgi:replicative DNA helicase